MRLVMASLVLLGYCVNAGAQGFNEERMGIQLSTVLVAAEPCGFSYDENAVKQYITENVPATSIGFPATLLRWTEVKKQDAADLKGAEKIAFCAATEHTAKQFGFIK